jgi:hypothetical protein
MGTATAVGTGLDLATVNGISNANEAVSAQVTVAAGQYAGLTARYTGPGDQNMYYGFVGAGNGVYTAYIYRNVNGTWTLLFAQSYSGSVTNATLEFDVVGASLTMFLNGSIIADATDTTLTTGSVGMRDSNGAAVMSNFSANPVVLQNSSSSTTFSDNFSTAGSNSQLSNFWSTQSGSYQVDTTSGTATAVGTGVDLATVNGIDNANESVSAQVTVAAGQYAGLVARYSGPGDQNMYYGFVAGGNGNYAAYIYRNVNGTWTELAAQTYSGSVTNATLQFDAVGSSLTLSLNGSIIASATDTTLTTGSVGMRDSNGGAIMSNFDANPLS